MRLKPGAIPVLFPWNNYSLGERRLGGVDGVKETDQRLMDEDTGDVDVVCANSEHDCSTSPELGPVVTK